MTDRDDATAKPSDCCPGERLVPMHSTHSKICTGCKRERPWPLEPGQSATFRRVWVAGHLAGFLLAVYGGIACSANLL